MRALFMLRLHVTLLARELPGPGLWQFTCFAADAYCAHPFLFWPSTFDLRTFSCSAPFRLRYGFVTSNLEKIPSKMRLVTMLRLPTPKHTLSLPVPCRNLNRNRNLYLNHLHPLITYRGKPRQTRPNRAKPRFIGQGSERCFSTFPEWHVQKLSSDSYHDTFLCRNFILTPEEERARPDTVKSAIRLCLVITSMGAFIDRNCRTSLGNLAPGVVGTSSCSRFSWVRLPIRSRPRKAAKPKTCMLIIKCIC